MKTLPRLNRVGVVCAVLVLVGCAVPNPNVVGPTQDPVVAAETALRVSKDTIDLFLHLEKDNQAFVKANLPQVHIFAEKLRREAPDLLISANAVKNTYKHNRSADNATSLLTVMATVNELSSQAAQYMTKINTSTP